VLLYADDANAHPSPQWLAKDGLHPHLAQQMADAREFHQKYHPKEGESSSARRTAGTPGHGGIAIDQVSKYSTQA
jgi:hypothetical protein